MMWKKYKLSEIGTVVGGATPSTTVERFYGGDIPWLTPKDLSNFQDRYIEGGERNITREGLDSCSAQLLPANSVLFSSRAPIGYVAIAKNPIATNQGFKSIIPNEKVDSLFLYYILRYNKEKIEAMGSGTTFKEVSGVVMKNIEVALPSLEEQRRIAGILGTIDDKIENNRRINTNLELQAQALYKQWFVDSSTVKLGDVVKTTSGGTPSRSHMEFYVGKYGWVKSKELNSSFITKTEETITDDAIAKSAAKLLPAKSILIAMYGATVGQYAILSQPMTCNQAVCALLPNENYPYTYLFMVAKNIKEELANKAIGSAQQNISQVIIKDIDISSDIEKIKQFHKIVCPHFEVMEKNQKENETLATLRDTLLPKLMNGEIKL